MKMKNLALFWVLLASFALSACNTTRGLGEDVEATGEGIQKVAEDTEEEIEESIP
jgi:entericidin B